MVNMRAVNTMLLKSNTLNDLTVFFTEITASIN
jgi:hypothetical protein